MKRVNGIVIAVLIGSQQSVFAASEAQQVIINHPAFQQETQTETIAAKDSATSANGLFSAPQASNLDDFEIGTNEENGQEDGSDQFYNDLKYCLSGSTMVTEFGYNVILGYFQDKCHVRFAGPGGSYYECLIPITELSTIEDSTGNFIDEYCTPMGGSQLPPEKLPSGN